MPVELLDSLLDEELLSELDPPLDDESPVEPVLESLPDDDPSLLLESTLVVIVAPLLDESVPGIVVIVIVVVGPVLEPSLLLLSGDVPEAAPSSPHPLEHASATNQPSLRTIARGSVAGAQSDSHSAQKRSCARWPVDHKQLSIAPWQSRLTPSS